MGVNFQPVDAERFFGMKLLLVHPNLSSGDPLFRRLQSTGAVVLLANSVDHARQLFGAHAMTLELAVIHREPEGLSLLPFIKGTPALADLPYIVTSSEWSDRDFSSHQETPEGANAYLRFEKCESELLSVIEQVLGVPLSGSEAPATPTIGSMALSLPSMSSRKTGSGTPAGATFPSLPSADSAVPVKFEDPTRVFSERPSAKLTGAFKLELDPSSGVYSVENASPEESVEVVPEAPNTPAGAEAPEPRILARDEIDPEAPKPVFEAAPIVPEPSAISLPAVSVESIEASEALEVSVAQSSQADSALTPALPPVFTKPEFEPQAESEVPSEASKGTSDELPYLFGNARPRPSALVGDAVVPGGAAQSPDTETLKHYLALREQDVAALSAQLHDARNQIRKLEEDVRQSHALMEEQSFQIEGHSKREKEFEREKALLTQGLQAEIEELRFQMKSRIDKARVLESEVRESSKEMERLRERVRNDIRKIRVREKELENRLEIVKKDSEALLSAREATILELKRKLDTAEFNLDLMHDRLGKEKELSAELREKLLRASQAVRLAGGLLDPADSDAGVSDKTSRPAERSERKIS